MRKTISSVIFILGLLMVSCQPLKEEIHLSEANADFIPDATSPAIPTVQILALPQIDPRTSTFDFSDRVCKASWSNNGEYLPCPGDQKKISNGYANRLDSFKINGDVQVEVPALLTIPAQPESQYGGIFGKYPPYSIQEGDRFRARLACRNEHMGCDATASLEFFTADNQVEQVSSAEWHITYDPAGGFTEVEINLDYLAGRTLQFLLVVRENGDPIEDHIIWIQPHIANSGTNQQFTPQEDDVNHEMVLISGTVDMASAPPFLFDDHPPGSNVVVVLFNAGTQQLHWISTEGTHPDFQLEVIPGSYFVHAYAPGVGDVPYVTGAYTGIDPSCGEPSIYITAHPGEPVENIVINDWNFDCGNKMERFPKPDEIPLP